MVFVVWNSQDAFSSSGHQIHWFTLVKTTGPVYRVGSLVCTPMVNMTHAFNGGGPYSEGGFWQPQLRKFQFSQMLLMLSFALTSKYVAVKPKCEATRIPRYIFLVSVLHRLNLSMWR